MPAACRLDQHHRSDSRRKEADSHTATSLWALSGLGFLIGSLQIEPQLSAMAAETIDQHATPIPERMPRLLTMADLNI